MATSLMVQDYIDELKKLEMMKDEIRSILSLFASFAQRCEDVTIPQYQMLIIYEMSTYMWRVHTLEHKKINKVELLIDGSVVVSHVVEHPQLTCIEICSVKAVHGYLQSFIQGMFVTFPQLLRAMEGFLPNIKENNRY